MKFTLVTTFNVEAGFQKFLLVQNGSQKFQRGSIWSKQLKGPKKSQKGTTKWVQNVSKWIFSLNNMTTVRLKRVELRLSESHRKSSSSISWPHCIESNPLMTRLSSAKTRHSHTRLVISELNYQKIKDSFETDIADMNGKNLRPWTKLQFWS